MKMKKNVSKISLLLAVVLLMSCVIVPHKAYAMSINTNDYYYIASYSNPLYVLDVKNGSRSSGANVRLYRNNGSDAQLFKLKYSSDGYWTITNKKSRKVLDVNCNYTSNGTNVQQYTSNRTTAQKWKIYAMYQNSIMIKAYCGKCLDINGGIVKNGSNIQIWEDNGTTAQRFILIPSENSISKYYQCPFCKNVTGSFWEVLRHTLSTKCFKNNWTLNVLYKAGKGLIDEGLLGKLEKYIGTMGHVGKHAK